MSGVSGLRRIQGQRLKSDYGRELSTRREKSSRRDCSKRVRNLTRSSHKPPSLPLTLHSGELPGILSTGRCGRDRSGKGELIRGSSGTTAGRESGQDRVGTPAWSDG